MAPQDDFDSPTGTRETPQDFHSLAENEDPGIVREFLEFLRDNKKWWLAPILVTILLLIGLAFLTASPAAPFIYSLF